MNKRLPPTSQECSLFLKWIMKNADFYKVLEQLKTSFGPSVCPLVVPYVEDRKVQCYIDLLKSKAYRYENGKAIEADAGYAAKSRYEGLIAAISAKR